MTKIKLNNFMVFPKLVMPDLDASLCKTESEDAEERRGFIMAVMLGLGYDLLTSSYVPVSTCGRKLNGKAYLLVTLHRPFSLLLRKLL